MLVLIETIRNDIPKSSFVVYYKNYASKDENSFKNIDGLKELFLPHSEMEFKVIDF